MPQESFKLVIDGGGTKTAAILVSSLDSSYFRGFSGPSNAVTVRPKEVVESVKAAAKEALLQRYRHLKSSGEKLSLHLERVNFDTIWVGLAGIFSIEKRAYDLLYELFQESFGVNSKQLKLVSDSYLLPSAMSLREEVKFCITVIAGTGSSSMCFEYLPKKRDYIFMGKSGGWGPHLGDPGSGYSIGLEALRSALSAVDNILIHKLHDDSSLRLTRLHLRVIEQFVADGENENELKLFLSTVNDLMNEESRGSLRKKKVASLAKIVFEELSSVDGSEKISLCILEQESFRLAQTILPLTKFINMSETLLVLTGSVFSSEIYQNLFFSHLKERNIIFKEHYFVSEPAITAIEALLREEAFT
ncbi:uncharacterized protein PRCAT00002523001 [Priceomyces carsonii]|uniref:uncharacterized protein n=1 Tax=Priceomyces carsonii TaxID=28549 RepID=UPI002ED943C8|nr:unnamed protein product [Priceomyces carsonii]